MLKWNLEILKNKSVVIALAVALTFLIGTLDYLTGAEVSLAIFYVAPIAWVSWTIGRGVGLMIGSLSALLSFSLNYTFPTQSMGPTLWNGIVDLAIFSIVAVLLARLKKTCEIEERLSRIDFLTGIPNAHDFTDILLLEMERSRRHERPLTLVYLDCDNFKKVNDTLGHEQGDLLLKEVANCLLQHTRKTDKIARMGGDEFTLMLSETNETAAREILLRLFVKLLTIMELYKWPVTFSLGAVTFEDIPLTTKDAIREADKMMQQAKLNGKNQLATRTIRSVVEQANKRWN